MKIITKRKLREFWEKHPNSKESLLNWYKIVKKADWNNFTDVKETYRSVDIYKDCVIFNIGGNKYRLIVKIRYKIRRVFIRFVLTHKEYDKDKWKKDCEC
jgi:mRNA interferase HigB